MSMELREVRLLEGENISGAARVVRLGCSELTRAIERLGGDVWRDLLVVHTRGIGAYRRVACGFEFCGERYVRLMCGAGHARTNRTMFIRAGLFERLDEVLRCGLPRDVVVAPSKWNAYYALSGSATSRVREPRVCVVGDCEVEMTKVVEWIGEDNGISKGERKLGFNLWDGMGLISPEFAQVWSGDLLIDYTPSAFIVRNAFCKGLVAVFDFHKFGREVAQVDEIKDIWGKVHRIEEVDMILTQSQFKMWSAYRSWDEYIENTHKYGFSWGVSKVAPNPELEKNVVFTNYQFLQVLGFSEEDMKAFCDYTVDWFKDVCGGDIRALIIYLLGKATRSGSLNDVWGRISDPYIKAILMEHELARDTYIKERIARSIDKKMRLAKMGKLLTKGNFQFMIADPYGLAQHAFGMKVTGLLKEHEHYSQYWNKVGAEKVIAERAPLTWRSEVNVLNLQKGECLDEWYKYLGSGIVYNVWGVDCMLAADSDYDGDIVYTTNNKYMLNSVDKEVQGVPITYQPSKIKKVELNYKELGKYDAFAYNTKIGYITNCSTTLYEMQRLYPQGSAEWVEIEKRLKLCRKAQGMEIDKAKIGTKVPSIPQHWIRCTKDMSEFDKKLVISKRPYFMRYLYSQYNKEYKDHVADFDRYSIVEFGYKYKDIPEKVKGTQQYKELKEYYDRKCPLLETDGVMNRMCWYMEGALKGVKKVTKNLTKEEAYPLLSSSLVIIDKRKLNQMKALAEEYRTFKRGKMLANSEYSTYDQYYRWLREKALHEISDDREELANLAIEVGYKEKGNNKDFCWDVFGQWVVDNLKKRKTEEGQEIIELPIYDPNGDFECLGERYSIKPFNFNCYEPSMSAAVEDEIADLDSYFDEDELFENFGVEEGLEDNDNI